MNRQEATSILITFVVGFVAGGYFYMNGHSFKMSDTANQDAYSGLIIEGNSYGNCESTDGCLSFQLLSDGSYVVLLDDEPRKAKDGFIPASLANELKNQLTQTELNAQSQKQIFSNCVSEQDGVDYTFRVTLEEEEYVIDTCRTSVKYNSFAWLALAKLWNHFQTLK